MRSASPCVLASCLAFHLLVGLAVVLLLASAPIVQAADAPPAEPTMPAVPLPPELPWSGESRVLIASPSDPWVTPAEESGMKRSPSYARTMEYLRRLVDAAPELAMLTIGRSDEGRDIPMVVASIEGADSPEKLARNGRPTLLVQSGIHSGEIDGKDAGLMLLRDMTVAGTRRDLLAGANLLFVPIVSPDAHERRSRFGRINQRGPELTGWRTNARNLNPNRDYTKLDTPEIRAMVRVLGTWAPDLCYDVHVTDGIDYQYDVTFGWNGRHAHSPAIARWLDETLRPAVEGDLSRLGHTPGPLIFAVDRTDMEKGIWDWTSPPRFSHGYGDARHVPTVLVENHSLKPFERRVLGTYVLLESTLRALAERGGLRDAIRADRARRPDTLPVTWRVPDEREEERPKIAFLGVKPDVSLSPISGDLRVRWTGEPWTPSLPIVANDEPGTTVELPRAYWVPASWKEVIARLANHGVRMESIDEPVTRRVEMYRLRGAELAQRAYEGRVRVDAVSPELEIREETFPAGSVRVPLDQPLGILAALLLEPASPDSLFRWGFFHPVLQRTEYAERYILEPLAEAMLSRDAELARAFREKLAEDDEFRADPRARLEWFYERSPYYDERYLLYPVAREVVEP